MKETQNSTEPRSPYYIVYEDRLVHNLEIIDRVQREAGVKIIMALKANALWRTFPIIARYVQAATASSLNEMRLALDYLGDEVHSYCPVYTSESFPLFLEGSTHITFNSVAQARRFMPEIMRHNADGKGRKVSGGLRVNPQCSVIETDIYNPCLPGSRFGVSADVLRSEGLPEGVEGFHFHALCESSSYDLEKVLEALEDQFGSYLPRLKWLNMGGGHLMTRSGYDVEHLIGLLKRFKAKYPNLEIIMEPGSAFTWRTGDLVATVLDVVDNQGVSTAIIDASFACHMPDCLEMPYKPTVTGEATEDDADALDYRIGGNSCLSGDFVEGFRFPFPLAAGTKITFEDMNHYTTVKTHSFNGIAHPSIWLCHSDGSLELLREFTYSDYRDRMD